MQYALFLALLGLLFIGCTTTKPVEMKSLDTSFAEVFKRPLKVEAMDSSFSGRLGPFGRLTKGGIMKIIATGDTLRIAINSSVFTEEFLIKNQTVENEKQMYIVQSLSELAALSSRHYYGFDYRIAVSLDGKSGDVYFILPPQKEKWCRSPLEVWTKILLL